MRSRHEARLGWVFIGPALLHLFVFALIPILYAGYLSLFKVHLIRGDQRLVGIENYAYALTEPAFLNALWNSLKFALLSVPSGIAVALAVAVLVNQKLRGMAFFRTAYYLPAITSGVAIAMLWIYVYLPKTGLINTTLGFLGLPNETDFLNQIGWAMPALAFMSVWTGLGPKMVLFLAGLVGIPQSLYEAAELDGAGKWRTFRSVTLPMLVPTTFFVLVTSTIAALQVFTPVYMMTRGGPDGATDVVGFHIYSEAWVNFNTGLASAKSFVLLAVILLISIIQYRLLQSRMEGYSAS